MLGLLGLICFSLWIPQSAAAKDPSPDATDESTDKLSTRQFGKDVLGDFAGLFSIRNAAPFAIGVAGTALATIPEQSIQAHFAPGNRWGAWAEPGHYLGNSSLLGAASGTLFWASRKSDDSRFRAATYSLLRGSIVNAAVTRTMKVAFNRQRPNGESHSFPSDHASTSFMWATVFASHYGRKAAIPGFLAATYIAASRLERNKHHLTDVVAGAAIGYLAGKTAARRTKQGSDRRVTWHVVPMGRGAAASIQIRLF